MRKIYTVPFKTFAIILSFILVVIMAAGCIGVFALYELGAYTKSAAEVYDDIAQYIIGQDAYNIFMDIANNVEMPDYYRYGIRFEVKDQFGNILYSDVNGHDYEHSYSAFIPKGYRSHYNEFFDSDVYNNPDMREHIENADDVHYNEKITYPDGYVREGYYVVIDYYPNIDCTVTAYLLTGENWAEYNVLCRGIPMAYALRFWIFPIVGVALLGFIVLMVFLICAAGKRKGSDEAKKGPLDKVPFDVCTALTAAVVILLLMLVCEAYEVGDIFTVIVFAISCSAAYFILLSYFMSFAVRLKCGGLFKNTLIYIVLAFIFRQLKKLFKMTGYILRKLPLIWRSGLIIFAIAMYNFIVAIVYEPGVGAILWLIEAVVLLPLAFLGLVALKKIQKGGQEISRGNLEYQIDTKYMKGSLKDFSEDLNSIGEGLSKAVDERMKSERFKTELITNVSHDIKTPLTSIINYVDLIKKEQPENENMRQYVDVLDRQSTRLKKLIEDLVEASKASTGSIAVEMEKCDVGVILAQAAGEFDEKLKKNELELIMNIPEEPVYIMADGRHLWRVVDNLMNNICKYAQPGTRVYINIENKGGKVSIVFRNISRYALNLTSDEFLERFTRGDTSRSTEGSGLGLSIANSLTEVQGGAMHLTVDGDLFKVSLTFDEA